MAEVRMTHEQAIQEAQRAIQGADFSRAMRILEQLIHARPTDPLVHFEMGRCQLQTGSFAAARASLQRAHKLAPQVPEVLVQLARSYELERKFPEAIAECDKALALNPGHIPAIARKARILDEAGDKQAAYDLLAPRFDPANPDPDIAFTLGAVARRLGKRDEARQALEALLKRQDLHKFARSQTLYRLGTLLDEAKEYERAFSCYEQANQLRAAPYNAADTTALVDRIISVWTKDAIAKLPRATTTHNGMVFIVGMPRAGKTLVEQILASHPKVYGSGELSYMNALVGELNRSSPQERDLERRLPGEMRTVTDLSVIHKASLDKATRDYIQRTAAHAGSASIVTDKYALNYFHLGLISLMFPKARILHCSRHPFDTCLSCYFQSWTGSYHFSHALRDLAMFYKDYQRLMAHWRSVLDLPMLDVVYEQVVNDQEAQTRRMIDFLGLPWDERCLRFYETDRTAQLVNQEQVRKPMYRSALSRWRNYANHVGPLKDVFGDPQTLTS